MGMRVSEARVVTRMSKRCQALMDPEVQPSIKAFARSKSSRSTYAIFKHCPKSIFDSRARRVRHGVRLHDDENRRRKWRARSEDLGCRWLLASGLWS